MNLNRLSHKERRCGAAMVLVCLLLGLVFIAVAFSLDIARVQLAQIELQSAADTAARAGAEAMARGVGNTSDPSSVEAAIRDEIDMVANFNSVGGSTTCEISSHVEFGVSKPNENGAPTFEPTGGIDSNTDCVRLKSTLPEFPVLFGAFVGTKSVSPNQVSAAMVQQRDIVVVLDKSTSMFSRDAGEIPVQDYNINLRQIEEDLFLPSDPYYAKSAFVEKDGKYELTRRQALKLAVFKFRQEIDNSRGNEQLGLVTYGSTADDANAAPSAPGLVDLENTVNGTVRHAMIGDGLAKGKVDGAILQDESSGYANFDFNYVKMRYKGSTHIADGIAKGVSILFGPGRRQFATPILIVMTDGRHNQSGTPKGAATTAMNAHPNLRIYTIAFGKGAKKKAMEDVADVGRGTFYEAKKVEDLVDAFVDLAKTAGVTLIE